MAAEEVVRGELAEIREFLVRIPVALKLKLVAAATIERRSQSSIVADAITCYLDRPATDGRAGAAS